MTNKILEEWPDFFLVETPEGEVLEVPREAMEKRRPTLRSTKKLKRSGHIKKKNKARADKKFARNFGSEARVLLIKRKRCIIGKGCEGATENAHTVPRGMGGAGGSYKDIVPLCTKHHALLDSVGPAKFEEQFGLSLEKAAKEICRLLGET